MSPNRQPRRRRPVEAEPELALEEMEQATQRLRDQAWKLNGLTRTPLIPEDTVRSTTNAAPQSEPGRRGRRAKP